MQRTGRPDPQNVHVLLVDDELLSRLVVGEGVGAASGPGRGVRQWDRADTTDGWGCGGEERERAIDRSRAFCSIRTYRPLIHAPTAPSKTSTGNLLRKCNYRGAGGFCAAQRRRPKEICRRRASGVRRAMCSAWWCIARGGASRKTSARQSQHTTNPPCFNPNQPTKHNDHQTPQQSPSPRAARRRWSCSGRLRRGRSNCCSRCACIFDERMHSALRGGRLILHPKRCNLCLPA